LTFVGLKGRCSVHFLLLLLELLLDRLLPTWRDGLAMVARSDGRIEQVPTGGGWWNRWLSWICKDERPLGRSWKAARAPRRSPLRSSAPADPLPNPSPASAPVAAPDLP
jgi:hypothetical protein